jgi:hypothetical protein
LYSTNGDAAVTFTAPISSSVFSQTLSPQTAVAITGTNNHWSSPQNALASDDVYATVNLSLALENSDVLRLTNFGFSVPDSAKIVGIAVTAEMHDNGGFLHGSPVDATLTLAGSSTKTALTSTTSDALSTLGGSTELWGLSPSATDVNNATFGVDLVVRHLFSSIEYLDAVQMVVYYTTNLTESYTLGESSTDGSFGLAFGTNLNSPLLTISSNGAVTATSFSGDGSSLTNLNASNIASGTLSDSRLSSNVPLLNGTNVFTGTNRFSGVTVVTNANNQFIGVFSGNGGGLTNLNAANLTNSIADARLSSNVALLNASTNTFSGAVLASTFIGGTNNSYTGSNGVIGGGMNHTLSGTAATIAGGSQNQASQDGAAVGGGAGNKASGLVATVGGGEVNIASGLASTVPGGFQNTASGDYSMAGGLFAKALHQGSFVWSDSSFFTNGSTFS